MKPVYAVQTGRAAGVAWRSQEAELCGEPHMWAIPAEKCSQRLRTAVRAERPWRAQSRALGVLSAWSPL